MAGERDRGHYRAGLQGMAPTGNEAIKTGGICLKNAIWAHSVNGEKYNRLRHHYLPSMTCRQFYWRLGQVLVSGQASMLLETVRRIAHREVP